MRNQVAEGLQLYCGQGPPAAVERPGCRDLTGNVRRLSPQSAFVEEQMATTLRISKNLSIYLALCSPLLMEVVALAQSSSSQIGREVAIARHLQDGEEFTTPVERLIQFGARNTRPKSVAGA